MYHISRSQSKEKPFQVSLTAENGELLSHHLLKTKQACIKNIKAQCGENSVSKANIQDNTLKTPYAHRFNFNENRREYPLETVTPYIPGKNPVKKKK